jgi:hypothetical protein
VKALVLVATLTFAQSTTTARGEIERAVAELQQLLNTVRGRIPAAAAALNIALQDDPQLKELNAKVAELEAKVRANVGEPEKKGELEKDLGALFDAKLAVQEALASKLDKEAASLRKTVRSRRARKSELVKRRLAELAGESSDLDW